MNTAVRCPMLHHARHHTAQVPAERWASTPVLLVATAGLRMLPAAKSHAILTEARKELAASGLQFMADWASIASGQDEGLYAWIAANYASGALSTVCCFPARCLALSCISTSHAACLISGRNVSHTAHP